MLEDISLSFILLCGQVQRERLSEALNCLLEEKISLQAKQMAVSYSMGVLVLKCNSHSKNVMISLKTQTLHINKYLPVNIFTP